MVVHAQGVLGLSHFDTPQELFPPAGSSISLLEVRLSKLAILCGDLVAIMLAFVLSVLLCTWMVTGSVQELPLWWAGQELGRLASWGAMGMLGTLFLLISYQHYSDRRPFWDELRDFLRLIGLLSLLDMSLVAISQWPVSLIWWTVSWTMVLVSLISMRGLVRYVLKKMNLWVRPTVIIGVGPNAADAAKALNSQPELGFRVLGFVSAGNISYASEADTQPRLYPHQMQILASQPGIQWVIAVEHAESDQREHWLRQLAQWGATDISVIPAMRGVPLHGTDISHFFSHEVAMLRMRNNLRRWPARLTKRVFDTLIALILLLCMSPVMALIAVWIRRDGGPALFAHPRVGKRGKAFKCYKFRTMVVDAEQQLEQLLQHQPELCAQWENERKLTDDPRVNGFGRFLRASSLDELPQLINVIRGEMSLVGPRPVVATELPKYGDEIGYYLMVRPGMTGLWQVSGRSDLDYDTRVYLDTWYVKNWSLWHDQIILLKTIDVVFRGAGAR